MEVKLITLINSMETIKELSKLKVKAKTAWMLAKSAKAVEAECATFEDVRRAKIEEIATEEEEGNKVIKPNTPEMERFQAEINELLASDVEVDVKKIDIEDLGDNEIEFGKLLQLEWLIND